MVSIDLTFEEFLFQFRRIASRLSTEQRWRLLRELVREDAFLSGEAPPSEPDSGSPIASIFASPAPLEVDSQVAPKSRPLHETSPPLHETSPKTEKERSTPRIPGFSANPGGGEHQSAPPFSVDGASPFGGADGFVTASPLVHQAQSSPASRMSTLSPFGPSVSRGQPDQGSGSSEIHSFGSIGGPSRFSGTLSFDEAIASPHEAASRSDDRAIGDQVGARSEESTTERQGGLAGRPGERHGEATGGTSHTSRFRGGVKDPVNPLWSLSSPSSDADAVPGSESEGTEAPGRSQGMNWETELFGLFRSVRGQVRAVPAADVTRLINDAISRVRKK